MAALYLLLLYNKRFKMEFGVQLLRNYPLLVEAAGQDTSRAGQEAAGLAQVMSNILDRITVQVLHSSVRSVDSNNHC